MRYILTFLYIVLLIVITDLSTGYILNDSVAFICKDNLLHHKYCPDSTRTYNMVEEDGGNTFESHWNKSSVRVEFESEKVNSTTFENFDHIIISDSFGAQRQVAYEDRMSSVMTKHGINTVQVGAGSWNFVSYHNFILNTRFKRGATVHVILMANDLYSNYGGSIRNYYNDSDIRDGMITFPGRVETVQDTFKRFLINTSFIYQNIFLKKSKGNRVGQPSLNFTEVEISSIPKSCSSYVRLSRRLSPLSASLLLHAYTRECYDDNLLENLKISQILYHNIESYAEEGGVNVLWYFMPNGTFSSNEVPFFKMGYGLSKDAFITTMGLSNELSAQFGQRVVNFEEIFKEYKAVNAGAKLYYPYDGHLNKLGSKVVADTIMNIMIEK